MVNFTSASTQNPNDLYPETSFRSFRNSLQIIIKCLLPVFQTNRYYFFPSWVTVADKSSTDQIKGDGIVPLTIDAQNVSISIQTTIQKPRSIITNEITSLTRNIQNVYTGGINIEGSQNYRIEPHMISNTNIITYNVNKNKTNFNFKKIGKFVDKRGESGIINQAEKFCSEVNNSSEKKQKTVASLNNVNPSEEKQTTVVSLNNINASGDIETTVTLTLPELPRTIDLLYSVESTAEIFKQVCASKSCSVDQKKLFNENLQIFQQSVKWIDAVRSDSYGKPSIHNALYTEIEKYVSFLLGGDPEFRNLASESYNLSRCTTEVANHNQTQQINPNNFNNKDLNQPITQIPSNEVSKDQEEEEAYNSVLSLYPEERWEEYPLEKDAYQHYKIETAIERIRQLSERLARQVLPLDSVIGEYCRLQLVSIASDVVSSATFSSSVSAFAAWLSVLDVGPQLPDSFRDVWTSLLPNPVEVRKNRDMKAAESGISLKQEFQELRKEFNQRSTSISITDTSKK
uniref:Uncharacterized protein n=1 Tax=Strigamia maritima TaxID=126957 RepID=T1IVY2_STRMM